MIVKIVLCMSLTASACFGEDPPSCGHTEETLKCVKYLRNYDGDTITFQIPGVHPLLGDSISVRVLGVDTPEIKGKTQCEKDRAKIVKKAVQEILKKAKRIDLEKASRGKYFRIVADVVADGKSLTEYLISHRMAYPYYGKSKLKVDWCQPLSQGAIH